MPDETTHHTFHLGLRCLTPTSTERYHLVHEGDWTRGVYDTRDNRFDVRAAPPSRARALVFMLNALSRGWEVVAVPSRFNVILGHGSSPLPEFFELEDSSDDL